MARSLPLFLVGNYIFVDLFDFPYILGYIEDEYSTTFPQYLITLILTSTPTSLTSLNLKTI
jgi:hypothetical protein